MSQIPELIDRALQKTGTVSALGKALGIPPSMVSMWKSGAKPCPPEDQARLAAIAGLDPIQTLVRAHIERHEGTEKGDQLARVLGKFLVATGGVIASAGVSAQEIYSATCERVPDIVRWLDTMYRIVKSKRGLPSIKIMTKAPI